MRGAQAILYLTSRSKNSKVTNHVAPKRDGAFVKVSKWQKRPVSEKSCVLYNTPLLLLSGRSLFAFAY